MSSREAIFKCSMSSESLVRCLVEKLYFKCSMSSESLVRCLVEKLYLNVPCHLRVR